MMKTVNRLLMGALTLFVILTIPVRLFSQATLTPRDNVNINSNLNGLLEILPSGYNASNPAVKYPLLIFIQGLGSTGPGDLPSLQSMITGTSSSIGNGYPQDQVMNNAWPDSYTVNGTVYKFIVVVPQFVSFSTTLPTAQQVNELVDYAVAHYNVDTTRIYLSGNSFGGGIVWDYASASSAYANRLAAILPFSGVSFPSKEKADVIRNSNVAVWAFHNELDLGIPRAFTEDFVNLINSPTPSVPQARITIFPGATSHDSWFNPLNRLYVENGQNIYEWMLQFSTTPSHAFAGNDVNLTLPSNSTQLSASWTSSGSTASSYSWQQLSGPSTAGFNATNISNPTVSGLVEGTYIFRVTITPNTGAPATDDVAITVYPPRIEAENYATMSGVTTGATTDEGGGNTVQSIDNGDYMTYNITVPVTGNYTIRFRTSANAGASQFLIKNAGGTILDTMTAWGTPTWDTYATLSTTIPLISGSQVIRIESIGPNPFYMNWLQVLSLGVSASPLPVNFTLFNSQCTNGTVQLTWITAREENTLDFSLERSRDGRNWESIAIIPAKGQDGSEQSYVFKDISSGGFYRVIANDVDGRKTYSSIIKNNCSATNGLSIFPNPVRDIAQLQVDMIMPGRMEFSVADNKGAIILKGERQLLSGSNQLTLDLSALSKGGYTIMVRRNDEIKTIRFVKQ